MGQDVLQGGAVGGQREGHGHVGEHPFHVTLRKRAVEDALWEKGEKSDPLEATPIFL